MQFAKIRRGVPEWPDLCEPALRMNRPKLSGLQWLLWGAVPLLFGIPPASAQVCSIDLGPDTTICDGQTAQLQGPPGFPSYAWSTGASSQNITVSTAGTYTCQVSYPTGNLAVNGNFSAGNTGFSSMFNYTLPLTTDGNYWIGSNANTFHNQWSGTGNGPFLMVNAGWMHPGFRFWCQTISVCPGQTYTMTFRAASLAGQGNPTLAVFVNNVWTGVDFITPGAQGVWQTFSTTWTAPAGITSADFCVQVSSGHGIGNDFGFDDVSISANVVLTDQVDVFVTPLPAVDLGPDQTLCTGQSVVLDATLPGATYAWQDGSTNATYTVSAPGTYDVTVSANGCSASDLVDIAYNPTPVVDLGPDQTLCSGQSTGFDATTPGATYLWMDGSTGSTHGVDAPGIYGVTVTVNGCSAYDEAEVTYNPTPNVDLGQDQSICEGDLLFLDATLPGASYLWSDGSTDPVLTVGAPGTYGVTVDLNGCSASDAVNVDVTPLPVVDIGPDQTICPGETITLDAAVPGATYLWSNGATSSAITVGTPGVYAVEVTVNGCTAVDVMTLGNHALPVFNLGPDQIICEGELTVFSTNVPGATYLWNTGSTASSLQTGAAGTYWLDVTTNGCTVRDTIMLAVTPLPSVDLGSDFSLCPGEQAILDATAPGATYLWNTGNTGPTLLAGTGAYSVEVTVNGCSADDAIVIGAHPSAQVDLGGDLVLCPGDQVLLDVTQAGAAYLWQDGSTGPTYQVGSAGMVSVELTDANGCQATDAITVTVTSPTPVNLGPDAVICNGDLLVLDATIAGASSYLWSTGAQTATITIGNPGSYSVTVTQGTCTVSDAIQISTVAAPIVDLGPDQTLCTGETLTLDANSPSASYQWSTGETTPSIEITQGGAYSVVVTNAAGCTATDAITVVEATPDAIDLGPDLAICDGQQVVLDAMLPGAIYSWSTGATSGSITVGTSGIYWVEATQGNCTVSDTLTVLVNPSPTVDLGPDLTLCSGEPVVLDGSFPGATYLWSTGDASPTLQVSAAGTYSVTVDLNGCTSTDAVDVQVVTPAAFDLGPDVQLCAGNQVVFALGIPGATYGWSTGASTSTINVATSSTVWVVVTQGPCVATDTVIVSVLDPGAIELGPSIAACAGDQVVLDATLPNAAYSWNTGATTAQLTVTESGTYEVTATVGPCTVTDAVEVTIQPLPVVEIGGNQSICPGASASFNATLPGATYLWHDGSTASTYTTDEAEAVSVTVTINGCSSTDQAVVEALPSPIADLGPDTTLCAGASLLLSAAQAGATYLWSDGTTGPALLVDEAGAYSVSVNLNGCEAFDDLFVGIFNPSDLDLGADQTLCPGESVALATGLPGEHQWSTGATAPSIVVNASGSYWVNVEEAACFATDTVVVTVVPLPLPDLGAPLTLCAGDSAVLRVEAGGADILWSTGAASDSIVVSQTGNYGVVLSLMGCMATDAVAVAVLERVESVSLGTDSTLCPDAPLVLSTGLPSAQHAWSTGESSPTIAVTSPGTYVVQVTGPCIDAEASITVTEGICGPYIHVPNTFTPNGDGRNDLFQVVYDGPNRDFSLDIFNRWGERIAALTDPAMTWDGTSGGTAVPDGVYVWKLRFRARTDAGAQAEERIGHVTVLR